MRISLRYIAGVILGLIVLGWVILHPDPIAARYHNCEGDGTIIITTSELGELRNYLIDYRCNVDYFQAMPGYSATARFYAPGMDHPVPQWVSSTAIVWEVWEKESEVISYIPVVSHQGKYEILEFTTKDVGYRFTSKLYQSSQKPWVANLWDRFHWRQADANTWILEKILPSTPAALD